MFALIQSENHASKQREKGRQVSIWYPPGIGLIEKTNPKLWTLSVFVFNLSFRRILSLTMVEKFWGFCRCSMFAEVWLLVYILYGKRIYKYKTKLTSKNFYTKWIGRNFFYIETCRNAWMGLLCCAPNIIWIVE